MTETAWLTAFILANVLQFIFGIVVTGLSFLAYRASGGIAPYRNSTVGFLLITLGGVLAPVYQLGIKDDFAISGRELLELQLIEGSVIAAGLAFLLISIYSYKSDTKRVYVESFAEADEAADGEEA